MSARLTAAVVVVLVAVAACSACATDRNGSAMRVAFSGVLRVEGMHEKVVLTDDKGRIGRCTGDSTAAGIPGCSRDSGREGPEPGEDFDSGDFVVFTFSRAVTGHYVLWLMSTSQSEVELSIQRFLRPGTTAMPCGPTRQVRLVGETWYRVDLELGVTVAGDTCGVVMATPRRDQPPKAVRIPK